MIVFERRALADAVATEQADHLALADRQGDAVQDVALAVEGVHLLDCDEGFVGGRRRVHVLR